MVNFLFGFVDKKVKRLHKQYCLLKKIKKYIPTQNEINNLIRYEQNNFPNKIWTLWLQGYDNAPPIVKACIDSMKKHSDGREVIVLDENNLYEYVHLPEFIIDKYNKGLITKTHFSDIIRCALLDEYGGTWIDSTVFCSNSFEIYTKNDLMFFQKLRTDNAYIMSSYFMHTKNPNNHLIKMLKNCLYNYWDKNDKLADYFLLHLFFTALTQKKAKCQEIWKSIPVYISWLPQLLIQEITKPNNKERVDYVLSLNPIHKLSYKEDGFYNGVILKDISEDSYWNEITKPYM